MCQFVHGITEPRAIELWCIMHTSFLTHAPIAWDNLRIDVYGFIAFCRWFFSEYPSYYIVPLRVSGSAVETLFAQYKYLCGSKLDAVNYTTARSKYLCKKKVEATHHSGRYYRDMPLNTPDAPLKKKKYNSKSEEKW